jgi:hypothetical protein
MSKQKRHLLSLETSVDFELIGICSHHSDYRLAWGLNQSLRLQLAKSDELCAITNKKGQIISEHAYYFWYDDENQVEFYLIRNKSEGKFLIPERNQIDYFLFLRENVLLEPEELLEDIKQINSVMAAYLFEPESLPSTEQIVF